MSSYEKDSKGWVRLEGARVTCLPILVPNLKIRKIKLIFIVLADGKEFTCIVWGKFALILAQHLHIGRRVHVRGKEKQGHRRPLLHVYTLNIPRSLGYKNDAVFKVEKSGVWELLSKVPGVSRLIPKQMKVEGSR